ncbi:MAG: DUF4981 domain-containing protein, partial [Victivallales bacterium]|nr:DUF4981 domain-containing protein [Victivallales bacterium]
IGVEAISLADGRFSLKNKQDFIDTSWFSGGWTLLRDGGEVSSGTFDVPVVAPRESAEFAVSGLPEMSDDAEYHLNLSFSAKLATSWCEKGYEVAWEQFELTETREFRGFQNGANSGNSVPVLSETPEEFVVESSGMTARVSRKTGAVALEKDGVPVMLEGLQLNMWRGCTDNDGIRDWDGQEAKPLGQWTAAGFDSMRIADAKVSAIIADGEVEVVSKVDWVGSSDSTRVTHEMTLTFTGSAGIAVRNTVSAPAELPSLPRIGLKMKLASGFDNLEWFGRGPGESYIDRRSGTPVGKYECAVADTYVPYIMPQEHGNHVDTRWFSLGSDGVALKFAAVGDAFEFSARHVSDDDLYAVRHGNELNPKAETFITLDKIQRGLGTGSCGPPTLDEYCIPAGVDYEFAFEVSFETK